jgi:hypothetical protein
VLENVLSRAECEMFVACAGNGFRRGGCGRMTTSAGMVRARDVRSNKRVFWQNRPDLLAAGVGEGYTYKDPKFRARITSGSDLFGFLSGPSEHTRLAPLLLINICYAAIRALIK